MKRIAVISIAIALMLILFMVFSCDSNGNGNNDTDTIPPIISELNVIDITATTATISWTTNELATSYVECGDSIENLYIKNLDLQLVTNHSIRLNELKPNTTYFYRLKSADASENVKVSDDKTFITASSGSLEELSVHFIDVGQGDAILIDKGETEILIDGGEASPGVIGYLSSYVDGNLEVMVATHMHVDHIGGLIAVLNTFNVDEIWHNEDTSTSQTYNNFMTEVNAEGAQFHVARRGNQITVDGLTVNILNPVDTSGTSNNNSIVLSLSYGDIDFIFTGDAEQEAESSMLTAGIVPDVEILKVGHHGSVTASSASFLAATSPEVAIYMAGIDNTYGHPHEETIVALDDIGATIYGTDVHGTIVVTTDGVTYDVLPTNAVSPVTPDRDGFIPTPTTDVVITNIDLSAEIATIQNNGDSVVDMTGWKLKSVTGDQTYTFPSFSLAAGSTVDIVSGLSAVNNPPTQLLWTNGYIWNNDGDPGELYDKSSILISSYNP